MRWYKRSIVFAIGLLIEVVVAVISCLLIKENNFWLSRLSLPIFAPHSFLFYGFLMETIYLSSAASLALYATNSADLPKGTLLTAVEGFAEILTLLFFFKFTYEITAFFLATATMLLSQINTMIFLNKSDAAGITRLPCLAATLYLWVVVYCILMINFA